MYTCCMWACSNSMGHWQNVIFGQISRKQWSSHPRTMKLGWWGAMIKKYNSNCQIWLNVTNLRLTSTFIDWLWEDVKHHVVIFGSHFNLNYIKKGSKIIILYLNVRSLNRIKSSFLSLSLNLKNEPIS